MAKRGRWPRLRTRGPTRGKGEVLGIATAQAFRNVLAGAGVPAAENSAGFLGHLPGRRGARGIWDIRPGALLVIDEASMMSIPDLREIIAHAARQGAKVIIAGDHEQLTANRVRRWDDAARPQARLRATDRGGPVHGPVGTGRVAAPAHR